MKKIIFVLAHLQYSDGVAKVLCDICNALPSDEFDITVKSLYTYDTNFIKQFNKNIKTKSLFGLYFRGLDKFISRIPKKLLYKAVVREKYDIEIGFQYGRSTELIAASTNDKAVHIAWMHTYDEGLVLLDSYKKMDKVICVSKCNAERLSEETKEKINVEYLYNLVDDTKLNQQKREFCDIEKQNFPLFVSVGRHSAEKGYERLIKIFADAKEKGKKFECWLIGDGPEHKRLKFMIQERGLENCIKLLGAQKNPHKYTTKGDIFICSSFSEGYSTACTEAAILGIPIITTDVSGGREIIEEAECGLLTKKDDNSLSEAINYILDNPEVISKWKEIAAVTAEKFSLKARKKRMIDLFETFTVK